MRNDYRFIMLPILLLFFCMSTAHAVEVFVDTLYWQANESIDWASVNNDNATNQQITYKSSSFNYQPGIRLGLGYKGNWNTLFYYTRYYTSTTAAITGADITSGFLGARLALLPVVGGRYQAEQLDFTIDYHMLNWDFGKPFHINQVLALEPIVGLQAGVINQAINTHLQGSIAVNEYVKNNFSGVGPKVGISTTINLLNINNYQLSFYTAFATAYLWGQWTLSDFVYHQPRSAGSDVNVKLSDRDFGALALQAFIGGEFDYKQLSAKLGYEIADWFNQVQEFDNATGAHNNSLVLQGLTLSLAYNIV